ncbi:MAG: RluA family pseudouridine synthase [Spirochaetaceae bacterium]|jgi:23S rRNA pseudouridine955/2504/2580 synthase|nr:RluA family pseudouridine synthase [Spirochaetaceae bacterium]
MILTARADDDNRRLDRILRKALPELPLSALHRLLRKGRVRVNGRSARGEDRIQEGAEIYIDAIHLNALPGDLKRIHPKARRFPGNSGGEDLKRMRFKSCRPAIEPKTGMGLDILWEGAGLLILNKPAGLAVHGESPDRNSRRRTAPDTLERRVRAYLAGRLPESLSFKPGPLHRLDKPTSGSIVFSESLEGARCFSALLREGKIRKQYLALLDGGLTGDEVWEDMLLRDRAARKTLVVPAVGTTEPPSPADEARPAVTRVTPLARAREGGRAWTLARLETGTGRTHQIRAQAARRGHALSGDRKYGGLPILAAGPGFFLHAAELELPEAFAPLIRAPLPEAFHRVLRSIFGETSLSQSHAL